MLRSAPNRVVGRPFRKGQSGNPLGRPRAPEAVRVAKQQAAALSPAVVAELEAIIRNRRLKLGDRLRAAELVLRAGGVFDDEEQASIRLIQVEYVSSSSLPNGKPA